MKIDENCVEHVKAFLEETLGIEVDKKDVRELVEDFLDKLELAFELDLDLIIYKYLNKFDSFERAYKFKEIPLKARKENLLSKIKTIIAYYHEDYDTLADKITDILSDSSPNFRP